MHFILLQWLRFQFCSSWTYSHDEKMVRRRSRNKQSKNTNYNITETKCELINMSVKKHLTQGYKTYFVKSVRNVVASYFISFSLWYCNHKHFTIIMHNNIYNVPIFNTHPNYDVPVAEKALYLCIVLLLFVS